MPYVGKKPADIIATAVDTTTGKFSGEVDAASLDISGNIDVDGTTNLDVVDIDGAVDMASTLAVTGALSAKGGAVFNEDSADVDFRVESNGNANMLFVNGGTDRVGIGTNSPSEIFEVHSGGGNIAGKFVSTDSLALIAFKDNSTSDVVLAGASGDNLAVSHDILFTNASKGVYLGVTSATASNLLDDYEEGTWTPNIGGNASYIHQSGTYVKVGRFVFLSCDIKINAIGTGVATQLNGAPFTPLNTGYPQGGISIMYYDAINTAVTSFNGYINNNNTAITFSGNTGTAATTIGLNGFSVFKNSARVSFSISYQTSA
jgi:hypothetical protein